MELRALINERLERGQSEAAVLAQLGDPLTLAESYLSAVPMVPATFMSRVWAKVFDGLTFLLFIVLASCLVWFTTPRELAPFVIIGVFILGSLAFALYTVLAESRYGQTLGKRVMGLCAVRESGARISFGQAIVRQLPMFFEVFAVDALFALFTEKHQRAFELLSKTRVVKCAQTM
jgi:uncharacterized RDD family membrane protein YckC